MTSHRRHGIKCTKCKNEVGFCPSCGSEMHPDTAFSRWLRELPYPLNGSECSNQNLDYIWFRFYQNWFITIEEKTNGKEYDLDSKSDNSQVQSHGLVRQMLTFASGNEFDVSFGKHKRQEKIEYRGHYLIVFHKTNPEDSEWIKINNELHNTDDLIILLTYGKLVSLEEIVLNLQMGNDLSGLQEEVSSMGFDIHISTLAKY